MAELTEKEKKEISDTVETVSNEQMDIKTMKLANEDTNNAEIVANSLVNENISNNNDLNNNESIENIIKNAQDMKESPITIKEVNDAIAENDSIIGKFTLTDKSCIELLNLVNITKDSNEPVTYKQLPDQIKGYVDNYMASTGCLGFSTEYNTMRNSIANMLITEYTSNIEMKHIMNDFNSGVEKLYDETNKELSPLIKDYNDEKEKNIKNALETIEDPEKKANVERCLESIHQAYSLEGLKEFAHRCKIKKFDLEKINKIFDPFLYKYKNSQGANIYDLYMTSKVLEKHLKQNALIPEDDETTAEKFFIIFCKYCMNFSTKVPEDHAFMYYVTYNISLLDVYKGDIYTEFANPLLHSVLDVVNNARCNA